MRSVFSFNSGADPGGGGGGGVNPPPALDHQFFFSTNFLTIAKKKKKNRSEYSMDTMYLNLMFINPRPPDGRR